MPPDSAHFPAAHPLAAFYPEIARRMAGDAGAHDDFGDSIALSGDTLVIGAPGENGGPGDPAPLSGAVYVFERDAGGPNQWGQVARLSASDAQAGDAFGNAVGIDGDTIVVGANGEDGGPGEPWEDAGSAYVFERNLGGPGNWGEAARLFDFDPFFYGDFGVSVAIDGDTIVVGATGDAGPPFPGFLVGAAFVFSRDQGGPDNWGGVAKLTSGDPQELAGFGTSVTVSGNLVAVGAIGEDGDPGDPQTGAGAVYLFERDLGGADNWGQAARLTSADAQAGDGLGDDIDLYADTLAVGAGGEDGGPGDPLENAGAVYLFERDLGGADNWGQAAKLIASDAQDRDFFGLAVAIYQDVVVVGSYLEDGGLGDPRMDAGTAYVYHRDQGGAGAWGQAARLTASDSQTEDWFGWAVVADGGTVVVAARGEDGGPGDPLLNTGTVYVYQEVPEGDIKIYLPLVFR